VKVNPTSTLVQYNDRLPTVQAIETGNKSQPPPVEKIAEVPVFAKQINQAITQANKAAEAMNVSMRFRMHDESDRFIVEIINVDNNEIIKEIPPKELLDMVGKIRDIIGLLLDEKR